MGLARRVGTFAGSDAAMKPLGRRLYLSSFVVARRVSPRPPCDVHRGSDAFPFVYALDTKVGLKNKNKSSKVAKYVQQVQQQVNQMGNRKEQVRFDWERTIESNWI